MSKVKNIFKGNAGFTLIELLIVIVIIGILAAIAIPNIVGLTGTADRGAMVSNMRTLLTEMEAYRARNGEYPGDFSDDEPSATGDFTSNALTQIIDESSATTYTDTDGFTFTATFDFGDGDEDLTINATEGFVE